MNTQHYSRCCLGKSHRPQPRRWRKHCSTCRRKRPAARLLPHLLGLTPSAHPTPRQPAAVPAGPDNSPLCQKRASCEGGHSLTSLILPPSLLGPPLWQSYRADAQGGRHFSLRCHSSLHFSMPPTLAHQSEVYYTRSGSISLFRKADLLFYHWCFRKHPMHTQLPKYIFNTVQAPFLLPMSGSLKETHAAVWRLQRSHGVTGAGAASQLIH